ncbi:MAG: class I SAM-dependent methyltransferase, partial [Candidatus Obscuribacterales bacterium]|nr:class I SAM-dependent methyltransferase [Candidatus Obscuribacterales bacterium]
MIEFSRFESYFQELPYRVSVRDSRDREHSFGQSLQVNGSHQWDLKIISKSSQADKHITRLAARSMLESYIHGEIEIEGDFRYFAQLRLYVKDPTDMLSFKDQFDYFVHCLRTSNPAIEKIAVRHHYDQPIEFVEGYLDTIVRAHSCCVFGDPLSDPTDSNVSLEEAAVNRERLAARKLQLQGKRVLDIGCGSGYFVNQAVSEFGASEAYGVTLSDNQKRDADRLFEQSGTTDKCRVEIKNYRDVEGQFDCINSVGMVSHIGPGMLDFYWRKVSSLLKPSGLYHHHCLMHYDQKLKQQDGLALF